jgi:hypothetical protein
VRHLADALANRHQSRAEPMIAAPKPGAYVAYVAYVALSWIGVRR